VAAYARTEALPLTAPAVAVEELDLPAVYAAHARYVAGVVHRVMGADGEVDDILQDTFLDAMTGLGPLREPAAVRAWLVTSAVRRSRAVLARRRRRRIFSFLFEGVSPRASDPRDRQAVDDLWDALDRLPEDLRIPWILHRVVALSLPEAAAACEVSLATVKRRIADAEERIERRLGPEASR
jgi:RNA polymerase sigma-70 factor (ECF subfamily)